MPVKIALLPGHKWLRLYRIQYKVTMTEANRLRLQAGQKLRGRPVPRLVSLAEGDVWMVPENYALQDVIHLAQEQAVPYFACRLDGQYFALDQSAVTLWCIRKKRIAILPLEEI